MTCGSLQQTQGEAHKRGPRANDVCVELCRPGDSGQLRMSFDAGAVTALSIIPKRARDPREIPIVKEQLVGALDPVAAVFFHARSDDPNGDLKVCDQTVPVFDGGWRFDLVLTPKRKVPCGKKPTPGIRAMPSFAGSSSSRSPVTHPTIPISGSCPIRMPLRSGLFRCLGPICMCPITFCCQRIPAYCQRPQHHCELREPANIRSLEPKSRAITLGLKWRTQHKPPPKMRLSEKPLEA